MSATTVDQRPKGQGNKVQNGSMHQKDGMNDDDFEPYLGGQTNQSNNYQPMSDPYMPSYYAPSIGFPYSLGEAAWSTAGDPPMPYLTAYGQMSNGEHHFIPDGVFGQPGAMGNTPPFLGQHGFNFFPGNADFSTWGPSVSQAQSTAQSSVYSSSYGYAPSSLGRAIADGQAGFGGGGGDSAALGKVPVHGGIEQGMAGLKLGSDMVAAVTKTVGSPLGGGGGGAPGMSSVAAVNSNMPPSASSSAPTPASWAAIARKPAKPQPKVKPKANVIMGGIAIPPPPIKHNMNIGTWDDKGSLNKPPLAQAMMSPQTMVQQPLLAQPQPLLQSPLPHQPQHQHQHQHQHQPLHQHQHQPQHQHQHQHQHQLQQQHQHQLQHQQQHQQLQHQQQHQQHQHHQHQHQPFQLQSPQHPMPPGPPHHPHQHPSHPHHQQHLPSQPGPPQPLHQHPAPPPNRWVAPRNRGAAYNQGGGGGGMGLEGGFGLAGGVPAASSSPCSGEVHPVLEKLRALNNYNPKDFDWSLKNGRVFIIKSYSEDDIHRSIKYNIWCSTEHGNKRLDAAYRSLGGKGPLYLLFSVNGSGHFCGVAEMRSPVDYAAYAGVWSQDKWKGKFEVKWAFVKDVPNNQLRHIRLENNDNKPVTNSRDTQEVPLEKAKQVLKIIATFKHTTSIFDDFAHYEKRQEEEEALRRERNRNKQ